jgi:hypothetical protein
MSIGVNDYSASRPEPGWYLSIDTPVGAISLQDKNEQPGGPHDWDRDEIMIDLSTVRREDWQRFVILDDSGSTYKLGEMMEGLIAEHERHKKEG